MKKIVAVLCLALMLGGCTTRTALGECLGLFTIDQKKPELLYDYSYWNLFMGFIFIETIIVPIIVVADGLKCPEAKNLDYVPKAPSKSHTSI